MGNLTRAEKSQKNTIAGAGIGGIGVVQLAAIGVGGAALNLTAWAGLEVGIRVSAECRMRWALTATPTTISTTDAASAAAPAATGGGWLFTGHVNFRDVPNPKNLASGEGVFLIVVPTAATVDVTIEVTS